MLPLRLLDVNRPLQLINTFYFSVFSVKKKPIACKPGAVSSVFESVDDGEENQSAAPKKGNNLYYIAHMGPINHVPTHNF